MKYIKSFTLKIFCLILILSCCCSCKKNDEDTPIKPIQNNNSQTSQETAVQGGSLKIPMPETVQTTHPLYIKENQLINIYSMIFEPLISFSESFEPAVSLAQNWKYDEQSQCWIIQMRQNVHWHGDLGEVSAQDAAFTINKIISDSSTIYNSSLSYYVSSAEANGMTLTIHCKVPSYALLYALNIPIIPQSYYENKGSNIHDVPIGSGCFCVDSLSFSPTRMELSSYLKWWKKMPYIEKISAIGYKDSSAMTTAFLAHEIDCLPSNSITTEIYEITEGVSHVEYMSHNYTYLAINHKNKFLSSVNFRKALAYALDVTELINNVYLTKATGAEQPLFNDYSLSNASVDRHDKNIKKSNELLAENGFIDIDNDGFVEYNGEKITLSLAVINIPDNPVRLRCAEIIKKQLSNVGINVNINSYLQEDILKTINNRSFDLLISGYYISDAPNFSFMLSSSGSGNICNYSSSEMNAVLSEIDSAKTLPLLKESVNKLQSVFSKELPHIGLFFEMKTFLYYNNIHIEGIRRDTNVYSSINMWYVK